MVKDNISTPEKINELRLQLNASHETIVFNKCNSMGELLKTNMKVMLRKNLELIR
jgi:hypothetical protein